MTALFPAPFFLSISPVSIITLTTNIDAAVEVVFDLSRSIDFHIATASHAKEEAVAGRMSGLIELDETVTWEATHFFVRQRMTVRITAFDRPNHFRDSMVSGAFARFDHDHHFKACDSGTEMTDVFDFASPLGPLGQLADWLFLKRYMTIMLLDRNRLIKETAESENAHQYIASS